MKKILLLLIVAFYPLYALVTIAPVESGDKPGFSGKVGLSLSTKKGNSEVESYKGDARVTYDNDASYVTWFQLSGEYGKANKQKNVENYYAHWRFIHNITDRYHVWEAALQTQEDKFRLIKHRRLAVLGYRQHIFPSLSGFKFFFGIGAMYENIKYLENSDPTKQNKTENNGRLNSYASVSYKPKKDLKISLISYYQPLFDDFDDFVTVNKLGMKVKLYKALSLLFSLNYNYDSRPPIGIKSKYDFSQNTSFVYSF